MGKKQQNKSGLCYKKNKRDIYFPINEGYHGPNGEVKNDCFCTEPGGPAEHTAVLE
jgi:hypothetical protein